MQKKVVVLATGGTIAGLSGASGDALVYRAAQLDAGALLAQAGLVSESVQVAQIDSKDMDFAVWQRLAQAAAAQLAREDVAAVVLTHGTDTMEETAWFLQRVLAPAKPVVITGAMRPADAADADGPRNLRDAFAVARSNDARGVVVAMAGEVHAAADVRKLHSHRVDAFSSGDAGPLARVREDGTVQGLRAWPQGEGLGLQRIARAPADWPKVAIVTSCAGVDAGVVDALVAGGTQGIVVAATGNGTVSTPLADALRRSGVRAVRASRCASGGIVGEADGLGLPSAGPRTAVQARVDLLLDLLGS